MTRLYEGLGSEKNPSETLVLDWTQRPERATCYVAGGSLEDLENRTTVNKVLRTSSYDNRVVVVPVRAKQLPRISHTGRQITEEFLSECVNFAENQWQNAAEEYLKLEIQYRQPAGTESQVVDLEKLFTSQKLEKDMAIVATRRDKAEEFLKRLRHLKEDRETEVAKRLAGIRAVADKRIFNFKATGANAEQIAEEEDRISDWVIEQEKKTLVEIVYRHPVMTPGVKSMVVHHKGRLGLPKAIYPWLATQYELNRAKAPDFLQYADAASVGPGGKPLPMGKQEALLLEKFQKGAVTARPHQLVAWYWLIVSWNQSCALKDRVALPKGSRTPYQRKTTPRSSDKSLPKEPPAPPVGLADLTKAVREALEFQVPTAASTNYKDGMSIAVPGEHPMLDYLLSDGVYSKRNVLHPSGSKLMLTQALKIHDVFAAVLERERHYQSVINSLTERIAMFTSLHQSDEAQEHSGGVGDGSGSEEPEDTDDGQGPPDFFEEGPFIWTLNPKEVEPPLISQDFHGVTYYRHFEVPGKGKGKMEAKPPPVPIGTKPPAGAKAPGGKPNPAKPEKGKGKETSGSSKKVDPLIEANPLRAKGVAASSLLSEEQQQRLRTALAVPAPTVLPPSTWASMTAKQRSSHRAASSLPRWATMAVIENEENLRLIEAGILTKETPQLKQAGTPKKEPTHGRDATAGSAWAALKAKYPGVGLFSNPFTRKEKALKKEYDILAKEFAKSPSLPKVRVKPGSSTSRAGVGPSGKGASGLQGLAPIIDLIGMLSRAFNPPR